MNNHENGIRDYTRDDRSGDQKYSLGVQEDALFEVVFVGSGLHYSLQTCRHIASEFHVHCHRVEHVDGLFNSPEAESENLRLLIFDQSYAEDFLRRPDEYQAAAGSAMLVLAYRKAAVASAFLRRWTEMSADQIGFLPMNVSVDVWLSTLRLLLHRHPVVPAELLGADSRSAPTTRNPNSVNPASLDRLTCREREVLGLLARGESNKRIAGELAITEHTVKLHVHNLVKKMGVSNRTAAAALFVQSSQ